MAGNLKSEDVRKLCIKHDWFTNGTNEAYEKLFALCDSGAKTETISLAIWLCTTGWDREEIELQLEKYRLEQEFKRIHNSLFELFEMSSEEFLHMKAEIAVFSEEFTKTAEYLWSKYRREQYED